MKKGPKGARGGSREANAATPEDPRGGPDAPATDAAAAAKAAAGEAPTAFYCRRCGAALSLPLRRLPDWPPLTLCDGVDALPRGFFFRAPAEPEFWQRAGAGPFVVNLRDVVDMKPTGDRSGCCGPSGMDGPNLACPAGHTVATEVGDCWTPRMALFDPASALDVATPGAEGPSARVLVVGEHGPLRSRGAFLAWAHAALELGSWHGDDLGALVADWLSCTFEHESVCILWLNADASARAGVPLQAIKAEIEGAHRGAPRRLILLFG